MHRTREREQVLAFHTYRGLIPGAGPLEQCGKLHIRELPVARQQLGKVRSSATISYAPSEEKHHPVIFISERAYGWFCCRCCYRYLPFCFIFPLAARHSGSPACTGPGVILITDRIVQVCLKKRLTASFKGKFLRIRMLCSSAPIAPNSTPLTFISV